MRGHLIAQGIFTFFLNFHLEVRDLVENLIFVSIDCVSITPEFEKLYGYHGSDPQSTAFIFNFLDENHLPKSFHWCLGNKCSTGCNLRDYRL